MSKLLTLPTVFEAALRQSDVENYAFERNVSIDEAIETLGHQYIARHGAVCAVWDENHSKQLEIILTSSERLPNS